MKPQFRSSMQPIQHMELDHIEIGFWDVKSLDAIPGIGHWAVIMQNRESLSQHFLAGFVCQSYTKWTPCTIFSDNAWKQSRDAIDSLWWFLVGQGCWNIVTNGSAVLCQMACSKAYKPTDILCLWKMMLLHFFERRNFKAKWEEKNDCLSRSRQMHISSECSSVSTTPALADTTILLNLERAEYLKRKFKMVPTLSKVWSFMCLHIISNRMILSGDVSCMTRSSLLTS